MNFGKRIVLVFVLYTCDVAHVRQSKEVIFSSALALFVVESYPDNMTSDDTVALARQEAFKDFSYFDDETVPANVHKPIPLQPLKTTSAIILTGYIPENASRFSVNLLCKAIRNIALHFNPRLDRGYIVRNTRVRGSWEDEETCSPASPSGCIFRRNTYVHLMIFCTNDAFQSLQKESREILRSKNNKSGKN